VSKAELAGPFPWYKTIAGGPDPSEEAPGALYVLGTTTDPMLVELFGEFEFKASIATNNTPAAVALREELRAFRMLRTEQRERERVMKALSHGHTGLAPSAIFKPL
jgi:hypothetical protein